MPSGLRIFGAGVASRTTLSTTLSLRHSSRAANVARYSAIWSYFSAASYSSNSNPLSGAQHAFARQRITIISSSRRHASLDFRRDLHSSRLHWTTENDRNQKPRTPTEEEQGSRQANTDSASQSQSKEAHSSPSPPVEPPPLPRDLTNYSQFFRQLAQSVPHIPRPNRDDLLKLTSSWWHRLRIRFKWLTIRSFRKFNADDLSAFFSVALLGQTLWILIGTTTFFSVVIATMNSLRLQSFLAKSISDYLTHETGVVIAFESAIVPKWRGSSISFKNVYISRRPSVVPLPIPTAALEQRAARFEVNHEYSFSHEEEETVVAEALDDSNYSMFDLNVDSIDVTLSLTRWLDGKGLVEDAVIKGVRGILDRRNVTYDPDKPLNPADFRHQAKSGDFHLESLKLEDILITVYQPNDFRPYTMSIFTADLHRLRKQWFCSDFLQAENIVGQMDNCLFSLHRPQGIGRTVETDTKDAPWERMSRFRIDGLNIDHLQAATGSGSASEGPISWITSGKFDTVLDFKFPPTSDPDQDFDINEIVSQIANNISTVTLHDRLPGQRVLAKPALTAPEDNTDADAAAEISPSTVVVDIDLRFRDVKAAVPLFTSELSRVNSALIRPIVAFINANKTLVPIHCRVAKDISDFDGSWTLWETGLLDSIALKTYDALAYHVSHTNNRRIKTVTLWSLQQTTMAAVRAFRTAIEPLASQVQLAHAM